MTFGIFAKAESELTLVIVLQAFLQVSTLLVKMYQEIRGKKKEMFCYSAMVFEKHLYKSCMKLYLYRSYMTFHHHICQRIKGLRNDIRYEGRAKSSTTDYKPFKTKHSS